jgi:hypothetical protein
MVELRHAVFKGSTRIDLGQTEFDLVLAVLVDGPYRRATNQGAC